MRLLVISLFLRAPSSLRAFLRISFLEVCGSRALQANPKKQKTLILNNIPEVPLFRRQVLSLILTIRMSRVQESTASSGLPEGLGQASGRVDVPDGAKIEAAAAFAGTLCSRPGKLDALGSVRSREGKIQFFWRIMMGIPG